jgi:two-component system KDP operon response regulator KdpE
MRSQVLIIEDDPHIIAFLQSTLQTARYQVDTANRLETAIRKLDDYRPALILLDLGLPDGNGDDLLKQLRQFSDVPVLILSARSQENDIVGCLDAGADDYLVKPIGASELLARVRVALRHSAVMSQRDQIIQSDALTIDLYQRKVLLNQTEIHLPPKEYELLAMLAQAQGKVVTHRKLLAEVWGAEFVDHTHYLRIHMGKLRAKIETNPTEPQYILTEPSVGYRLVMQ